MTAEGPLWPPLWPPPWPTLNASLNLLSFLCLLAGYRFIRARRIEAHRRAMLAAFSVSSLFLLSYVGYHSVVGSVAFGGTGWIRTLYFAILLPHTVLAMAVAPLALRILVLALEGRFEEHKKLARPTWRAWVFVSLSGIVVYWMLYHLRV